MSVNGSRCGIAKHLAQQEAASELSDKQLRRELFAVAAEAASCGRRRSPRAGRAGAGAAGLGPLSGKARRNPLLGGPCEAPCEAKAAGRWPGKSQPPGAGKRHLCGAVGGRKQTQAKASCDEIPRFSVQHQRGWGTNAWDTPETKRGERGVGLGAGGGACAPRGACRGWRASESESTSSEFCRLLSKHLDHRNEGFDGDRGEGLIGKGMWRPPHPRAAWEGEGREERGGLGFGVGQALGQAGFLSLGRAWRTAPAFGGFSSQSP